MSLGEGSAENQLSGLEPIMDNPEENLQPTELNGILDVGASSFSQISFFFLLMPY